MTPRHTILSLLAIIFHTTVLCATSRAQTLQLTIGSEKLTVEVAETRQELITGLSQKTHLDHNEGMLFVFPFKDMYCMTMKDTKTPLALAFIDDDMNIIDTTIMQPETTVKYCASHPVRYALETHTNQFKTMTANKHISLER